MSWERRSARNCARSCSDTLCFVASGEFKSESWMPEVSRQEGNVDGWVVLWLGARLARGVARGG